MREQLQDQQNFLTFPIEEQLSAMQLGCEIFPNDSTQERTYEVTNAREAVAKAYAMIPQWQNEFIAPPIAKESLDQPMVENDSSTKHNLGVSKKRNHLKSRPATPDDIEAMVDLDIKAFRGIYKHSNMPDEEVRQNATSQFSRRIEIVGDWVRVAERNGKIVGFIMACPTSKPPEEFESWEKTTNNGTLEGTYDPSGEYIYVVSLAVQDDYDGPRKVASDMLIAHHIGLFVERGFSSAYFESRMPGLKRWVQRKCTEQNIGIDSLSPEAKDDLANEYFNATVTRSGKEQRLDYLLRKYESVGCHFSHVVPNAYNDPESMNYGTVGTYKNPLPRWVQKKPWLSRLAGKAIRRASRSEFLVSKLFK